MALTSTRAQPPRSVGGPWHIGGASCRPPTALRRHSSTQHERQSREQALGTASGLAVAVGSNAVPAAGSSCWLTCHSDTAPSSGSSLGLASKTGSGQERQRRSRPGFPGITPRPPMMLFPDTRPANLDRGCHLPGAPGAWSRAGPRPPLPPARDALRQSQRRVFSLYDQPGRSQEAAWPHWPRGRGALSLNASPERPSALAPPSG